MILWLIALILVASVALVGFYQGALRAAFSFVGLLLACLLANPIGGLLAPLIPILGLKNPVVVAFLAPVIAFVVILAAFKLGAMAVHKKVEAFYKYKSSDTQRMLFERMNARVGIGVGLANGFIYLLVVCTLLHALGYLTVQVASSEKDSWALRLVNRVNEDIVSTGTSKAVASFMPRSELYYDGADVVADVYHTPLLQNRLANYPPFLLVGEKDEFKPLSDPAFQGEWLKGELTFGSFINHEKVKPLVENQDVVTNVLGMLGGNFKDLKVYLETGKSPKYDEEKILGHWAFDYKASMNATRRKRPNMGSADFTKLKKALNSIFVKSTLTATIDQHIVLKLPAAGSKGTTRGGWKNLDGKYLLTIKQGDQNLEIEAMVDGSTIVFTKDGFVLVFENMRV
jgi:Colicin V production protein